MAWPFERIIGEVVAALVSGDYGGVVKKVHATRLTADDMSGVVKQYGRTLATPPKTAFASMDVIPVRGVKRPTFSVRMPLWTVEEGRSDLTLEMTVVQTGDDYVAELDDIHVL